MRSGIINAYNKFVNTSAYNVLIHIISDRIIFICCFSGNAAAGIIIRRKTEPRPVFTGKITIIYLGYVFCVFAAFVPLNGYIHRRGFKGNYPIKQIPY